MLKDLNSILGISSSHLIHPLMRSGLDLDYRSNYLPRVAKIDNSRKNGEKLVLLVGTNPRFEASSFNIRLRGSGVVSIGFPTDLTYRKSHIGCGLRALLEIALGKAFLVRQILRGSFLVDFIIGAGNAGREDGDSFMPLLYSILKAHSRRSGEDLPGGYVFRYANDYTKRRWGRGLTGSQKSGNIIHTYASTPGACELGLTNGERGRSGGLQQFHSGLDCLYLIGADSDVSRGEDT